VLVIGSPRAREILASLRVPGEAFDGVVEIRPRLAAVIEWIQEATAADGDGGISKGYDLLHGRWLPAYPETTGYTVPTLLNAASVLGAPQLRGIAVSSAEYLLRHVTPEGGVAHWADSARRPIVFDTGQVIFGWLAAFKVTGDHRFKDAAVRAGNWLAAIQDPSGSWRAHQHLGVEKVIDTRVAWALLELDRVTGLDTHRQAAVRNLEWALENQDGDGWFRNCAFAAHEDPYTHTLAYTAEGLLESGHLVGDARFIEAGRRTAIALLACQRSDGSLSSTFGPGWRSTSRSSCLTGDCQAGLLWLRLHQSQGDQRLYAGARRVIGYVAATQKLMGVSANIRGAIAGSYPIYGRYERFKYPNWAAKFFADALLALLEADEGSDLRIHPG